MFLILFAILLEGYFSLEQNNIWLCGVLADVIAMLQMEWPLGLIILV